MRNKEDKKIDAFTFVELIFTISIILIVSFSSIFYFNSYLDSKNIESDLSLLNSSIENLNKKVKNKEIYDYEINFSGKTYYLYKLNGSINNIKTNILFNENTKNYTLSTTDISIGLWNLKLYNDSKFLKNEVLRKYESMTGVFDLYKNYKIEAIYDSGSKDEIGFSYFSEDNILYSGNLLTLVSPQNITIKNINNKITIFSGSSLIQNISLIFEKGGVQKSLEFKTN